MTRYNTGTRPRHGVGFWIAVVIVCGALAAIGLHYAFSGPTDEQMVEGINR